MQELDARAAVKILAWHHVKGHVKDPIGAGIAVATRVLHQSAIGAEQAEIHPPCIHANAVDGNILPTGDANPLFDLLKETKGVPEKSLWQAHWGIGEAV